MSFETDQPSFGGETMRHWMVLFSLTLILILPTTTRATTQHLVPGPTNRVPWRPARLRVVEMCWRSFCSSQDLNMCVANSMATPVGRQRRHSNNTHTAGSGQGGGEAEGRARHGQARPRYRYWVLYTLYRHHESFWVFTRHEWSGKK